MVQVVRRLTLALEPGDMGLKSRADQIFHTLPTTRHRCNFDVWALAQSRGVGNRSLVTPERVLSIVPWIPAIGYGRKNKTPFPVNLFSSS